MHTVAESPSSLLEVKNKVTSFIRDFVILDKEVGRTKIEKL